MRDFDPSRVPEPRSSVRFPESDRPVDLEIGCGAGYHPIRYAKEHPERLLIAIERTRNRYARFEGRLAGHPELQNIIPVNDDAIPWVTHRVPEESLGRVFLLYPNPYPKSAQANKRWQFMPFMKHLIGCIKPSGQLIMATNIQTYAEEAKEMMVATWGLNLSRHTVISLNERAGKDAQTHFERKYLERGERCHELVFERV